MDGNRQAELCAMAITIAGISAATTMPGHALPANPERPLIAQTCDAATARLAEAQAGSPLISAEEQAQALRMARAVVARLCGTDQIEGHLPTVASPTFAPIFLSHARELIAPIPCPDGMPK